MLPRDTVDRVAALAYEVERATTLVALATPRELFAATSQLGDGLLALTLAILSLAGIVFFPTRRA